jgi:hypothetical protein
VSAITVVQWLHNVIRLILIKKSYLLNDENSIMGEEIVGKNRSIQNGSKIFKMAILRLSIRLSEPTIFKFWILIEDYIRINDTSEFF